MASPGVSVIIPTFNRASIVGEAIESVLSQSRPPKEVIVVDDGSTDDTLRQLEAFGDRIIVVSQANAGAAAARNAGAARATGDWIAFNDSDDRWSPDRMALLEADLAVAPPEVVAHVTNVRFLGTGATRNWFDLIGVELVPGEVAVSKVPLRHFLHSFFLIGAAFRRDCFVALGGFNTAFPVDEDAELAHRLAELGDFWLRGDVLADSIRKPGDKDALSLLRSRDPVAACALKEQQFRNVLGNSTKREHRILAAQALSSCLLDQARLIRLRQSPGSYRGKLVEAALAHPDRIKGVVKALYHALSPDAHARGRQKSFRAVAEP